MSVFADDCYDIVTKAKVIIGKPDESTLMGARGREAILNSHTHAHRIRELRGYLKSLIAGKEIYPKWITT